MIFRGVGVFIDGAFWKLVSVSEGIADLIEFAGGLDGVLHDAGWKTSWSTPVYWDTGDPDAWKDSRAELFAAGISGVEALKCKAAVRKEVRQINDKKN